MSRWFLFGFALAYVAVLYLWRSRSFKKRTGVDPVVFGRGDRAHDYAGRAMFGIIALIAVAVGVHTFLPEAERYLAPLPWFDMRMAKIVGTVLLVTSFFWVAVAQGQMGESFRIGIDTERRTEMVARGLFTVSRNPIFLGMNVTLAGFFLYLPNALTLLVLGLGHVLLQTQVRLEEEHLESLHGDAYREYCARVRRWL